jgi:hypothetical protein
LQSTRNLYISKISPAFFLLYMWCLPMSSIKLIWFIIISCSSLGMPNSISYVSSLKMTFILIVHQFITCFQNSLTGSQSINKYSIVSACLHYSHKLFSFLFLFFFYSPPPSLFLFVSLSLSFCVCLCLCLSLYIYGLLLCQFCIVDIDDFIDL